MKNIHIILTDKPSRLFKVSDELKLTRKFDFYNGAIYQHIYITNDEEIKEGDWVYLQGLNKIIHCVNVIDGLLEAQNAKKIILTTDQALINEGVQAIDDEFLEWFVKNPSCEEIEIENVTDFIYETNHSCYKIIIPKEEVKQETLEEASLKIAHMLGKRDTFEIIKDVFCYGAKWQQERSYSEEDLNKHVIEFLEWRENYFEIYHGNKNYGLYYARNKYNSIYYNEDRHTTLTRKYYNLHELLELFNKFKKK